MQATVGEEANEEGEDEGEGEGEGEGESESEESSAKGEEEEEEVSQVCSEWLCYKNDDGSPSSLICTGIKIATGKMGVHLQSRMEY